MTLDEQDLQAYAFGKGYAPFAHQEHFQGRGAHGKAMKLHREFLTPHAPVDHDELENLRADVEELRALLEELKANKN